jgi:RES domain-containing protein
MKLYRLAKTKYANDLAGTGCIYSAGRWHLEGTRVLYTAEYASLAVLEVLGHTDILPRNYSLVQLALPETASIKWVGADELPTNWNHSPAPLVLADIAQQWIDEGKYWIMRVPSVHSPTEFNFLLNPLHPEHLTLQIISIVPYTFDSRLK